MSDFTGYCKPMSYVKKLAGIIREVKKETGEEDVFKLVGEALKRMEKRSLRRKGTRNAI